MTAPPVFIDTVTQIPADFLNLVAAVIFGPLNQATTVPGVKTALGLGTMAVQNANTVAITGGTLDGVNIGSTAQATGKFSSLYSYAAPTDPNHAANKAYVDAQITGAGMNPSYLALNYLKLAGGTLTGPLVLSGAPAAPLQAATKQYVDTVAAGFVTAGTLNAALAGVALQSTVNGQIAAQSARRMYHDSSTMVGTSAIIPLRAQPAGDVMVWVAGIPVPVSQITIGTLQISLTFSPTGAVDVMYFGATAT